MLALFVTQADAYTDERCPAGAVVMARFAYRNESVIACEDLSSGNGTITVVAASNASAASLFPITLRKKVLPNQGVGGDGLHYLNYTKAEVLAGATADVLGNMLLGIHGFAERVSSCAPPPMQPLAAAFVAFALAA